MRAPKVFLVRRESASSELVKRALELVPVAGAIAANDEAAQAAAHISDHILGMRGAPLALVADFPTPLTVIYDDGSVEPMIEGSDGEHNNSPERS